MSEHSGAICADLDLADNPSIREHGAAIRSRLQQDPSVFLIFESPSGGLKCFFRVEPEAENHAASFAAIAEHLRQSHGLEADESGKDVSRLCFLSHDASAWHRDPSEAKILAPCEAPGAREHSGLAADPGDRPGDIFNARGDVSALLRRHGWNSRDEKNWTRPGKAAGTSATLLDQKIFYVFTSNATPLEPGRAYSKFSLFAALEHGGDCAAAARALAAQGFSEPIWDPLQGRKSQIVESTENAPSESLFAKLQTRKFDPANLTPEKEPILSLRGCPALFAGNLAALVGSEKSGKSHVIAAAARAITAPGSRQLGFESPAGGRIVYLDFEQDRSDFESLILRSGCDPEQISAYHLAGFMPNEARAALHAIAENEQGLVAILLDGYADLVSDPNDQSEANAFVAELMGLAERKQIAVFGILHLNPGSEEKSRGHLGSQLGRKCQTVFSIKTLKDGTRILYTAKARKRPVLESEGICFVWSDSARGFVEMQETPRDIRAAEQRSDFEQTLRRIQDLTGMLAWRNAELCEAIQQVEHVKKRTAQSRVKAFCDRGLLAHCATRGIYTSKLEGANDPK